MAVSLRAWRDAHVRVHLATLARIQPSSILNASSCRKHEPLPDGGIIAKAAVAVDAVWTSRSPLSRVGATERRSRDHGSHHTDDSQRANKLPTMPPATKLLQLPSAAKAPKPCDRAPASGCQLQQMSQGGF